MAVSQQAPTLVVISHYDAWAPDQLVALLDQTKDVPAGAHFDTCVVVNQCGSRELHLPERHADVTIFHRPNSGYNIAAWDHGWRSMPPYSDYLFLQEECRILRPNWLSAFRKLLAKPRIGLVGESLFWAGLSWDRLDYQYRDFHFADRVDGRLVPIPTGLRIGMQRLNIPVGKSGEHLQSLILAIRRDVLEHIGGFFSGDSYGEATIAESSISKKVQALGLVVREVGPGSFRYILHPQWTYRQGWALSLLRRAAARIPVSISARLGNLWRSLKSRGGGAAS